MNAARVTGIILILIGIATGAYLLGSMGGNDAPDEIAAPQILASAATSELVPGKNRLVMGIYDQDRKPILGAGVKLDVSRTDGSGKRVLADARFIADEFAERGAYVADVSFSDPGQWEAKLVVKTGKGTSEAAVDLPVLAEGTTPAIGDAAPKTKTPTATKIADLKKICTSDPPCTMHDHSIDESIARHRPVLVLFAAPGQCQSQLCGPQLGVIERAKKLYKDKVDFIHVEIYKPGTGEPVRTVLDWGLQNEPWTFIIDSSGKISDKFEGPVSFDEVTKALDKVKAD